MVAAKLKIQPEEEKTIRSKVAILWGREDLLVKAVQLLLSAREDWKVIGISNECSADTLAQEVKKLNPDVVIIHQGMYAGEIPLPIKLLQDHSALKIITVSLENNLVEAYKKQTICIKESADLLSIIEENADPDQQGGGTKPQTNFMNQAVPAHLAGGISKGKLEEIQNANS